MYTEYKFVLNIMVNDIPCNCSVHSVLIMTIAFSAKDLFR